MKYIIANWKANKTVYQSIEWANEFKSKLQSNSSVLSALQQQKIKIVICPSTPFIFYLKQILSDLPTISFGVQDISQFSEGSHTGEVAASMLAHSVEYGIVGHSERRSQLNESEQGIAAKVDQLKQNNIHSILCVRNEKDTVHEWASLVTFEPVDAIGSGNNMDVLQVLEMRKKLALKPTQLFIYGGSVTAENIEKYLESDEIDGVLIGKASLDPSSFFQLIETAVK